MSGSGHIALIDRLRGLPTETEWFEFKRNCHEPQELGEYLSALASAAFLSSQPRGYLDLILALVREHGPVARSDVDDVLVSKLPDRYTLVQKRRKIHNLLQELRRSGSISNHGSKSRPAWVLSRVERD